MHAPHVPPSAYGGGRTSRERVLAIWKTDNQNVLVSGRERHTGLGPRRVLAEEASSGGVAGQDGR